MGVCSWSLQPASPQDLIDKVRATGLDGLQLALGPACEGDTAVTTLPSALVQAGIEIRSGMLSMIGEDYSTIDSIRRTGGVRSDEHWKTNLERARRAADLAQTLRIGLVTLHAGFMPDDRRDPERAKLVGRLRELRDAFSSRGIRIGLETGQERAETLLEVLDEIGSPAVGVNFDPANMILYGNGDPVNALEMLAPHVMQVHIKDARASRSSGAWGEEVPVGTGQVDWKRFFAVLDRVQPDVDLMIERESGNQRVSDVRTARDFLRRLAPAGSVRS
jgi:L-ribulose-5-phosphate 3-epimerase